MNLDSLPLELRAAIEAAHNKLAYGVTLLDLRELGAFTSYFMICSGGSARQVQTVCDAVEEHLARCGFRTSHREGYNSAQWILLDYGHFVVHIFTEQARIFFDIERLWRQARRFEVPDAGPAHAAR